MRNSFTFNRDTTTLTVCLSVWREWLIENDTFVGMHYVMGQECSVGDREVKVK